MAAPVTGAITTAGVSHAITLALTQGPVPDTTASFQISGTYGTVTVVMQGLPIGSTIWGPLGPLNVGTGALVTSGSDSPADSATVQYIADCRGMQEVRIYGSTVTTGEVDVVLSAGNFFGAVPSVVYNAGGTYTVAQGSGSGTSPWTVKAVPPGTVFVDSHSGSASATNCTLTGVTGKTTYLAGFAITGLGATSSASIQITTTGLTNNLTFTLPIVAGATVANPPLIVKFDPALPASATSTAIVVLVPSFGSGNTISSASAFGYQV